ncbi:MAG: hypothetical protein MR241_02015 [Firmicutes bacterium]|uniref:Uncharacterized protein n=1 Tax=Candidatus Colimorpha enterica TaxID=3083063 RepID=A0AAE3FFG8_9BACT|nr:hypothetical protein [Candidatus Colimorpha enterica]MDD6321779.1 hypothetical protein [Bacillota bacterium]MDY2906988.1 hypothetical protein [Eubacteriales bacterium]
MRKRKPLIAVMLTVMFIISAMSSTLAASAVSVSEVLETTYAFDQILFGDDEVNGFTFVYYDKADKTIKNMVYLPIGESPWNPGLDMYTGPTAEGECEGYEYMFINYTYGVPTIHPSVMGNTGCAFTVPYTGTIKVMTYFRVGSVLPDSAELFIYKNTVSDDTLLFRQVGEEDSATAEYELTVDVKAGDIIYWFVDCVETNANDASDFNPRVVYTAVNDENVSEDGGDDTDDTSESPDTDNDESSDTSTNTVPSTDKDSDKAGTSAPATSNTTDNTKAESPDIAVIVIIAVAAAAVIAVAAVLIAKKKKK